jgi:hypothetical protein
MGFVGKIVSNDSIAIDSLINKFKIEKNYKEKSQLLKILGYLGTIKCITALLSELNSDVHITDPNSGNRNSIRLPILQAISCCYPDDTLFNSNLAIIERYGDPFFMLAMQSKLPKDIPSFKLLLLSAPNNEVEIKQCIRGYLQKVYSNLNGRLGTKFTISDGQNYISERKTVISKRK